MGDEIHTLDEQVPVETVFLKVLVPLKHRKVFDEISQPRPDVIWPPTFGAAPQVLQESSQRTSRLLYCVSSFGEREEQGWFSRLHELPPDIDFARPAKETIPAIAARPHHFPGTTKAGHSAIVSTTGNDDCHLILRGGKRSGTKSVPVTLAARCTEIGTLELWCLSRAAADAGADYVFANPLFLKPCSAAVFLPFLEQNFPHLAENYRQRYQDRAFLPPAYAKRLSHLISHLREKYKITRARRPAYATKWPVQAFDEQLKLF